MNLGAFIAIAAFAVAMSLGGAVTPADAGDKSSKKKVHVRINDGLNQDQRIRLEKAAKKLKAPYRDALLGEIEHRREIERRNRMGKLLGEKIGGLENIEDHIELLGVFGTNYGKRRKGGH